MTHKFRCPPGRGRNALAVLAAALAAAGTIGVLVAAAGSVGLGPTGLAQDIGEGFLAGALAGGAVGWGLARRRAHA